MNINTLWLKLSGDELKVSAEKKALNSIGIITLIVLLFSLVINLFLGLYLLSFAIFLGILLQLYVYYQSRFKKRYRLASILYIIGSYAALISNFFLNSGLDGPSLFIFFLTFHLLIAFTPRRLHIYWVLLHSFTCIGLLSVQYFNPDIIPFSYPTRLGRFFDIIICYIIAMIGIYLVTTYLRNNYRKEKLLAENRATKIKIQNRQLETLNEQKNKLFSIIAHDLSSPLNSIQSYLQVLADMEMSPEEKSMLEKELLEQTQNTSELLSNLLSWSKSQMEGNRVQIRVVPVKDLLERTISTQKMIASKKKIRLISHIQENLSVAADPDMLKLIIRNLLNNGTKFSPSGTEIRLEAKLVENTCEISVCDNGTGIPEEKRKDLFSFRAASTSGTHNEKGVGLGLVLCKEFTEMQNGKIWFETEEGKGTTFFIRLPLISPH